MRHRGKLRQGANAFARLDSIEPRHLPVNKDDFVGITTLRRLLDHLNAFFSRWCFISLESHIRKHAGKDFSRLCVVFYDQNVTTTQVAARGSPGNTLTSCKVSSKPESATPAGLTRHTNISAH